MFNFNEKVDSKQEKLFLVNRRVIEGRNDPEYYRPRHYRDLEKLEKSPYKLTTLDKVCSRVIDGPFGSAIKASDYVEDGIPFIRVADVTRGEGTIKTENMIFISEQAHNKISRSKVVPGDVVIAKTGATMGAASVIPDSLLESNIRGDLGALTTNDEILPEYVIAFINSNIGQRLFWRLNSGGTRGRVVIGNLKKYPIILPPLNKQKEIVKKLRDSYSDKKSKEKKAFELLSSFPELLIKYTGIELPKLISRKIFKINLGDIENALNPERYTYNIKMKEEWKVLGDVGVVLHASFTPSSQLNHSKMFSYLRIDDLPSNPLDYNPRDICGNGIVGSVQKIETGDILISRLGPTIENKKFIIAKKHSTPIVGSNEFIRFRCSSENNSIFILGLLRSEFYKQLMLAKSRGATPSRRRLSRLDFSLLPMPSVTLDLQNRVAKEYEKNIEAATSLLALAEDEFNESKLDIEKIILGEL